MKIKIIITSFLLAVTSMLLFTGFEKQKTVSVNKENDLFVLIKYKAQPGKHEEALSALNALILEVKKEPNFVNIKLLTDPADQTNILLYEQWTNEAYYTGDHMTTPHLQKFMVDAREFLAGPPDISFWKMNNDYNSD